MTHRRGLVTLLFGHRNGDWHRSLLEAATTNTSVSRGVALAGTRKTVNRTQTVASRHGGKRISHFVRVVVTVPVCDATNEYVRVRNT
jgi:hypothetical protein